MMRPARPAAALQALSRPFGRTLKPRGKTLRMTATEIARASGLSDAAWYLMENLTLSEVEFDAAFLEVMARLKHEDPVQYKALADRARSDPDFCRILRRTMLDAMVAINYAALIDDDDTFAQMLEWADLACRDPQATPVVAVTVRMLGAHLESPRAEHVLEVMGGRAA